MRYIPTAVPGTVQQMALFLSRELQRISGWTQQVESEGWQDLRFPAQAIDLTGASAPPTRDTSTSAMAVPGTLLFSGSLANEIAGIAQMPHGFVNGKVMPHAHIRREAASTEGVAWKIYYNILGNPGDQPVGWVGPLDGTVTVGDFTSAYDHCIVAFPAIDLTSYNDSCIVAWRVAREGNSDSYADVVRLLEFDIHLRQRGFGSADIYARKRS